MTTHVHSLSVYGATTLQENIPYGSGLVRTYTIWFRVGENIYHMVQGWCFGEKIYHMVQSWCFGEKIYHIVQGWCFGEEIYHNGSGLVFW